MSKIYNFHHLGKDGTCINLDHLVSIEPCQHGIYLYMLDGHRITINNMTKEQFFKTLEYAAKTKTTFNI